MRSWVRVRTPRSIRGDDEPEPMGPLPVAPLAPGVEDGEDEDEPDRESFAVAATLETPMPPAVRGVLVTQTSGWHASRRPSTTGRTSHGACGWSKQDTTCVSRLSVEWRASKPTVGVCKNRKVRTVADQVMTGKSSDTQGPELDPLVTVGFKPPYSTNDPQQWMERAHIHMRTELAPHGEHCTSSYSTHTVRVEENERKPLPTNSGLYASPHRDCVAMLGGQWNDSTGIHQVGPRRFA